MNNLVCDHCGGTNFYKDAGFFYCSECQIQSQEVQEQIFQDEEAYAVKRSTKLIKEKSTTKATDNNRLTSWECYNYILYGLTDELIQLGANVTLKHTIKLLWLRYLEKLQVFRRDRDTLPKLQALSSNGDAEIVYGKRMKRRRKSSTKSSSDEYDLSTLTSTSIKRLQAKKKHEFIKAQYDRFTENTMETPSLHNETLLSLQASSDKTTKSKSSITYNIYATKELYRKQSKYHVRKHRNDFEYDMDCHRLKYKKLSNNYVTSPYLLSINKLYCLLYLGLLIIGDRIQLSDLLRFLNEGKLSFKRYSQFFPEDIERKYCNFQDKHKNCIFNNCNIRKRTSDLAEFLNVTSYIKQPDFKELTQRYCHELNLPSIFNKFVLIIIKITDMKMEYLKQHKIIPNYEGRILSIILFLMKLFYGFDGVTEFKLNEFIEIINNKYKQSNRQFDLIEWLKYLNYRSLVLKQLNYNNNLHLYLDRLMKRKYSNIKLNQKGRQFHEILTQLNQKLPNFQLLEDDYKTTETPFIDTVKILQQYDDSIINRLDCDFTNDSLEFLLKPHQYLRRLKKIAPIKLVNGCANNNLIVEPLICLYQEIKKSVEDRNKFITVVPVFEIPKNQTDKSSINIDIEGFLRNYIDNNRKSYDKYRKRLESQSGLDLIGGFDRDCLEFYTPYERYWSRSRLSLDRLHCRQSKKLVKQLPYTFQIVFRECRMLSQQNELEFIKEFLWTETHLLYNFKYGKNSIDRSVLNKNLNHFLKNSVKYW